MEAPREGGLQAPPQLFEPRFIVSSLCGACPGAARMAAHMAECLLEPRKLLAALQHAAALEPVHRKQACAKRI